MPQAAGIRIYIDSSHAVRLYVDGQFSHVDWNLDKMQKTHLDGVFICPSRRGEVVEKTGLSIETSLDGKDMIRVTETKTYRIKVEFDDADTEILPEMPNEGKSLKCSRDTDSMSFQFINYLGRSRMLFRKIGKEIEFEVVPNKIDYEQDYVELTEAIARNCAALLLEQTGATSMMYRQVESKVNTILEQFVFLRQFCLADNLVSLFESIKRNPDRILHNEEVFKALGSGKPSKKFFTHPFTYGKEWSRYLSQQDGKELCIPQKIAVTHKYDSNDTPANRLVKFAFEQFDSICEKLIEYTDPQNVSECIKEAEAMHRMLDSILHDSFFDDIGDMDIIPQNNQVLQKREGYSQVFSAFSMVDMALQLNWRGQSDIYEGESKNVALLYEYWLFFELYRIIHSIDGCKTIQTDDHPFISTDEGITISLKEGKESCQSFELLKEGIKLNLYYNRTFSNAEFASTGYEGSYSRPFRPDYTIALFPSAYSNEREAIVRGAVSYVHFDAKYRVDRLDSLIGNLSDDHNKDEIALEKQDSVLNTYRRGDLLKMHTYNDAIRRTVGSYVLYPGDKTSKTFSLYDELLPGVGAFSFRPSIQSRSEKEVKEFIMDIIHVKQERASRLGRMDQYKELVVREPSLRSQTKGFYSNNERYILGDLRSEDMTDYYNFLIDNNRFNVGERFIFFFCAIKDGTVYSHHKDVFNTKYIRFYGNDVVKDSKYVIEPIVCHVESSELVTKNDLLKRLSLIGCDLVADQYMADYYYVMNVVVDKVDIPIKTLSLAQVNNQNGNDAYSPFSPKICQWDGMAF